MKTNWIPIEKFDKQTDDTIEYPVLLIGGTLATHKASTINCFKDKMFVAFEDHEINIPKIKVILGE